MERAEDMIVADVPSTASDTALVVCTKKSAESPTKTTILSTKAKAFSIEALIGSAEPQKFMEEQSDSDIEVDDLTEVSECKAQDSAEDCVRTRESSIEPGQISPPIAEDVSMEDICTPSESLARSKCHLEMTDLWKRFHELGTEMIITKSGRRMFPSLRISFTNLDPKANYHVFFDISPVDNKRYRYAYHRSSWLVAGRADPPIPRRVYTHPDGPFRGDSLMKQSLSFEKVKLTNNPHDKWGYIILNSMHKYQPRVHLVRYDDKVPTAAILSDLATHDRKSFTFSETQFIGVTAYQNQLITKLKIDSNPFAKGFRDSARITQIDRESVDLLIKASRHGYPQMHAPQMAHPLFADSSQSHLSMMPNMLTSKYPSILPLPVPNFFNSPHDVSKELLKIYIDRLTGSNLAVNSPYKTPTINASVRPGQMRFNPYKR